jgi:hypothetical protein
MIYCQKCGTENEDNANFCLECGTELKNRIATKKLNLNFEPSYIIFLERANGHKIGNTFPGYFKYEYEVNPNLLLEKAVQNNHLKVSNLYYRLEMATINDLKESLRKHNLKVSGRKNELIERINNNLTEDIIKADFPDSYYVLTNEGSNLVKENDHIIYYHKSRYFSSEFSLEEYHRLLKEQNKNDESLKYDLALELTDKNAINERKKGDWGLYRNSLLSKASVYTDIKKELEALKCYLEVINIDLSGLSNGNMYWPETILLAPGLIPEITKLTRSLDLNDNELEERYYSCAIELKLPKSAFTKEESFQYLIQAMKGDLDGANSGIKNKTSKMKSSLKPLNNL